MAAEVNEAIEDGALLGPAVAVVPAVPNVMVASVGYATEDSATNETGDYTADEGAITATAGFSDTGAHDYSCTDRQSDDSGAALRQKIHLNDRPKIRDQLSPINSTILRRSYLIIVKCAIR